MCRYGQIHKNRRQFLSAACLFPENLYNITVMNILLLDNDYKYAAEQMMLMLFPGERPVYPASVLDDGGARCVTLRLRYGRTYTTAICYLTYDGRHAKAYARIHTDRLGGALERPRQEQRLLKLAFYRAAISLGVPKPEWGCLTGVRPAKLLAGLIHRDGLSEAAAVRHVRCIEGARVSRARRRARRGKGGGDARARGCVPVHRHPVLPDALRLLQLRERGCAEAFKKHPGLSGCTGKRNARGSRGGESRRAAH